MMWPSLETTPKTITVSVNFVFITLGTLNRMDLHFGPVVITWICREHVLYIGASLISLVEHCVPFIYDRRLLSLLGFVHNWPTSRWYNWYNCHLYVPQFFQFPSKVEVLILLFTFFQFYSVVCRDSKVDYFASSLFFFLLIIIKSGLLAGIR